MSPHHSYNLTCKITVFLWVKGGWASWWGKDRITMSGTTGSRVGKEGLQFGSDWMIFPSCHGCPKPRQKEEKAGDACVWSSSTFSSDLMSSDIPTILLYLISIPRPTLSGGGGTCPKATILMGAGASCLLGLFIQLSSRFKKGWSMLQLYLYTHREIGPVVPNNRVLEYMKQKLMGLKGETDNAKTIVETLIPHFQ